MTAKEPLAPWGSGCVGEVRLLADQPEELLTSSNQEGTHRTTDAEGCAVITDRYQQHTHVLSLMSGEAVREGV